MSTQYPANITFFNKVYTPAGAYQKKIQLLFANGSLVKIAPGDSFTIQLNDPSPITCDISVSDWAVGYPNSDTPAAPAFGFNFASPSQPWHGYWSDDPGTKILIPILHGETDLAFNAIDDTRVFTLHAGRFGN